MSESSNAVNPEPIGPKGEAAGAAVIEKGEFQSYLESMHIKALALGRNAAGTEMIEVEAKDLQQICKSLKKDKNMDFLCYMTAVEVKRGYQVIIQLDSIKEKKSIVIKVLTSKNNPMIPSLTEIYSSANWQEREAYDMIGIKFEGHPDLRRILNPDDWEGFPLRKDYIGPIDELNQPMKYSYSTNMS